MLRARTVRGLVAITFASGSLLLIPPARVGAQVASPSLAGTELLQVLGDAVVGNPESARTLRGFSTLARWETGEWRYRITSGARRGETEVESLAPIAATAHGETWKRTIGQESTLHLREIAGGWLGPGHALHVVRRSAEQGRRGVASTERHGSVQHRDEDRQGPRVVHCGQSPSENRVAVGRDGGREWNSGCFF